MKPPALGTILPSRKTIAIEKQLDERKAVTLIAAKVKLKEFTYSHVEGEDRFYDGPDRYAICPDGVNVKWFIRRQDGYFYSEKQSVYSKKPAVKRKVIS